MISISETQFAKFQSLIYQHSGIRLDDRKTTLLTSRLGRRLRILGIEDVDHYYSVVTRRDQTDELQELIDVVTTNETSFYRTQPHFTWFVDEFLSEMVAVGRSRRRGRRLRIWSAACSIGAEPYTLSFCLHENRSRLSEWHIEVLASDLCVTSLEAAQSGIFSSRLVESLEPNLVKRYFREIGGVPPKYEVRSEYRERVTFFQHNLMNRLTLPAMDCIFLRNVLIYFDEASKQKVVHNVVEALAPGGYLVIGPSEGIFGLENPLEKLSTFLYRKPT